MMLRKTAAQTPRPTTRRHTAAVVAASAQVAPRSYYVVKNVFKVKPESFGAFEDVWKTRESHLKEMPGFVRFAMLRCENIPGKYVSETYWDSREAFENWTKSGAFASSHGKGSSSSSSSSSSSTGSNKRPNTMEMLEGPPAPEMYSSVTTTEL